MGKAKIQVRSICVLAGSMNFLPIVRPSSASTTLPSVILELLEGWQLSATRAAGLKDSFKGN